MSERTIQLTDGTRMVEARVSHISRRYIEVLWTGVGVRHFNRGPALRGRLKGNPNSPWRIAEAELERIGA